MVLPQRDIAGSCSNSCPLGSPVHFMQSYFPATQHPPCTGACNYYFPTRACTEALLSTGLLKRQPLGEPHEPFVEPHEFPACPFLQTVLKSL